MRKPLMGLASVFTALREASVRNWKEAATYTALCFFLILTLVESLTMVHWLLQALGISEEGLSWTGSGAQFETQIFYFVAPVTPVLFTLFLFSGAARLILNVFGMKGFQFKFRARIFSLPFQPSTRQQRSPKKQVPSIILICSMAAAMLLALYPYSPALNPDRHHVGVDTRFYAEGWFSNMTQSSLLQTVNYTFFMYGDRPLSLLAMYAVHETSGLPMWTVAMFLPVALAPLTVLATYEFSKEARFDWTVTSLAVVFAAFSYHFATGVFAGFLANWMALLLTYIFSGLLMRATGPSSWRCGFLAAAIATLALFTHAWTWGMLMGVTAAYAVLQVVENLRRRGALLSSDLKILAMILAVNGVANAARNYALSFGPRVEVLNIAQTALSVQNLAQFWFTINRTFFTYKFRTFLNPFMVFLSLTGSLAIFSGDEYNRAHVYIGSWLLSSVLPFMLGDVIVQARILYNLPMAVFAAYGLSFLVSLSVEHSDSRKGDMLCFLLVLFSILASLNCVLSLLFDLSKMSFP